MTVPKFSFSRSELKPIMKLFSSTVNSNAVLPILESVLLVIEDFRMHLAVTDLENFVEFKAPFKSWNEEKISVCVDWKMFSHFVNNSFEDIIEVEIIGRDFKMSSGGFVGKIQTETSDNFPKSPDVSGVPKNKFVADNEFVKQLSNCLIFVSNDELRPAMTGVNIFDYKEQLTVVATDAHSLYYNHIKKVDEKSKGISVIAPRKMCNLVIMHFLNNEPLSFSLYENHICIIGDNISIVSRFIDARFPDWPVVLPSPQFDYYVNRQQLKAFLVISKAFINRSTNQISYQFTDNQSIQAVGMDNDFSMECSYKIPVYKVDGKYEEAKGMKLAFNTNLLMGCLKVNPKDKFVKLSMTLSTTSAIMIDDTILLMPLMLNA